MRISNVGTIKEMTKIIVREGSKDRQEIDGSPMNVFTLDDVTVIFSGDSTSNSKPKFYGFVFEAIGRDFVITPDFELTVTDETGDQPVSYEISDGNFQKSLEKYLDWRLSVLTQFSL